MKSRLSPAALLAVLGAALGDHTTHVDAGGHPDHQPFAMVFSGAGSWKECAHWSTHHCPQMCSDAIVQSDATLSVDDSVHSITLDAVIDLSSVLTIDNTAAGTCCDQLGPHYFEEAHQCAAAVLSTGRLNHTDPLVSGIELIPEDAEAEADEANYHGHPYQWAQIGLTALNRNSPNVMGQLIISASRCVDRSNWCVPQTGDFPASTCDLVANATVLNHVEFVSNAATHSHIQLYSDGTLRFNSDRCIDVQVGTLPQEQDWESEVDFVCEQNVKRASIYYDNVGQLHIHAKEIKTTTDAEYYALPLPHANVQHASR
jgi:hypothetical protein